MKIQEIDPQPKPEDPETPELRAAKLQRYVDNIIIVDSRRGILGIRIEQLAHIIDEINSTIRQLQGNPAAPIGVWTGCIVQLQTVWAALQWTKGWLDETSTGLRTGYKDALADPSKNIDETIRTHISKIREANRVPNPVTDPPSAPPTPANPPDDDGYRVPSSVAPVLTIAEQPPASEVE